MFPPELANKIDDLMKDDLLYWRSLCFGWLLLATKIVVVGLVIEGSELIYEMFLIVRRKVREHRWGFRLLKAEIPEWMKIVAFVGWLLIVVGVSGEWIADGIVSDADRNIEAFNAILLRDANKAAGDAKASAKTAHEEADAVKGIADEAREDAKDALAKARTAQRELAHAEADAAKAQGVASNALTNATDASARATKAEASLGKAEVEAKNAERSALNALNLAHAFESELAQLKKKAADRVLNEDQQKRVALKIAPFLGSPYELGSVDTSEAETLLGELDAALSSTGWIYKASEDKSFRFIGNMRNGKQFEFVHGGNGVEIGVCKAVEARLKPAADRLAKALNSEEIVAFVMILPDDNPSPNNIHIMILGKP
jgi:hypothetical protein